MERIPEPELMLDEAQALAYARADFEQPHRRVVEEFLGVFPAADLDGDILDLGCGPGDITFRFARAWPRARLTGVDGSPAMLALARQRAAAEGFGGRVSFLEGIIPRAPIPSLPWQAIVSNSLLHHLHRPEELWETVRRCGSPGTRIFIYDLRRPATPGEASALVDLYAAEEPEILRRDFHHSLLAAFTVPEVERQLVPAGLSELTVRPIGDRHLVVHGTLT
jgi:ubiquinone/menaquinone biosynthesis C-methylase UbiE